MNVASVTLVAVSLASLVAPAGAQEFDPYQATFEPALAVPTCSAPGERCSSGELLVGRGPAEPNAPNTIRQECLDGELPEWEFWIDALRVTGVEEGISGPAPIVVGGTVLVEVDVTTMGMPGVAVDLYMKSLMEPSEWQLVATLLPSEGPLEKETLTTTLTLPMDAGFIQVLRAATRWTNLHEEPAACQWSPHYDRDDLAFFVSF